MARLDHAVETLDDHFYKSRFIGYVAVSAVTAFEVNVRNKVVDFSSKKHPTFGVFSSKMFEKTNARIKLSMLRDDFLSKFGDKYLKRFNSHLDKIEAESLRTIRKSVKSSYGNLVLWRHDFVHEGKLPQYADYDEARLSYDLGKRVIECFCEALNR